MVRICPTPARSLFILFVNLNWIFASQVTSSGFSLNDKYSAEFKSLFSDDEATSSGSAWTGSVRTKKKKPTVPIDLDSALLYLNEHGCRGLQLYQCTVAVENKSILHGFLVIKTVEERVEYLNQLVVSSKRLFERIQYLWSLKFPYEHCVSHLCTYRKVEWWRHLQRSSNVFLLFLPMCIKGSLLWAVMSSCRCVSRELVVARCTLKARVRVIWRSPVKCMLWI